MPELAPLPFFPASLAIGIACCSDGRFRQNETEEKEVLQEKHSIRVCPKVFTRKYLLRISSKLGLIMEFHSSQLRVPAVLMFILSCAN